MRRLSLVAAAGRTAAETRELAELHRWLGTLASHGVGRYDRLIDIPLHECDVLWVRGLEPADVDPRLPQWLERGGRLLATGSAVRLAAELGIASDAAGPIVLPDFTPSAFGLAGFGAHPLFTGLRDGVLVAPVPDGPEPPFGYRGRWPLNAGVVAVARQGFDIDPETVLAWEYPVGVGGILCVAFHPARPVDGDPAESGDADVVVANALVGDAVPHRDRGAPAAVWVPRGRRASAVAAAGTASRLLPRAPADAWPASGSVALDLTPSAGWTHAGRRLLVRGRPDGRREVWAPPFRIMGDGRAPLRRLVPRAACSPARPPMPGRRLDPSRST